MRKRPEILSGTTVKTRTGCGNLYVTVNVDENNQPFEVFTSMGKAGGCAASQLEAIGRLVSLALRSEVAPEEIVKQLKGISCYQSNGEGLSCANQVARVLLKEVSHV